MTKQQAMQIAAKFCVMQLTLNCDPTWADEYLLNVCQVESKDLDKVYKSIAEIVGKLIEKANKL